MNEENIVSDTPRSTHDDLVDGLAALPPNRRRRLEAVASGFRKDDRLDRMSALAESDAEAFHRIYGARGAIELGLYLGGRRAAAGLDDPGDEAA